MLERRSRLGKYEVMDELGIGAMATVYKARNTEDGSPVAIKIPDRRLLTNVRALQQFKREGQALVRLRHPNIVRVHSVGQQNDFPYIVMDYVDGHTLSQEMQSRDKFSAEEAIEFLLPIADALDYSHTEKTFHCDVKPGNIRLYRGRVPVLVDFGIAQTVDGTVWDEGKPIGSVWYMSPEQARGERASDRSDQYSLAIVAYEMLTGKVPFDGDNPYAIVLQQRDGKPRIPPEWSERQKEVMQRVLDKDPQRRFSSCLEFVRALQKADREPAISAGHPTVKVSPGEVWTIEPDSTSERWPGRQAMAASASFNNTSVRQNERQGGDASANLNTAPAWQNGGQKQERPSQKLAAPQKKALFAGAAISCFLVAGLITTLVLVRHHSAQAKIRTPAPIVSVEVSRLNPPGGRRDNSPTLAGSPPIVNARADEAKARTEAARAQADEAKTKAKVSSARASAAEAQEAKAEADRSLAEIAKAQAEAAQAEARAARAEAEAAKIKADQERANSLAAAKAQAEAQARENEAKTIAREAESRRDSPSRPVPSAAPSTALQDAFVPAQLVRKTIPKFPQNASNRSINIGIVTLRVTISRDGKVSNPKFVSGSLLFSDAAVACVKEWEYEPAKRNGQPVESQQTITVTFFHE